MVCAIGQSTPYAAKRFEWLCYESFVIISGMNAHDTLSVIV